jgi:glycosyltransferase involved in cell wall biosynthesis
MVSVLITVYNSQSTISKTIESILNQTFKNFEIIIVDDGSTDATCNVISLFEDFRIRLFQPGRLGRAKALNYATFRSIYNWVAICDSDDIWHPNKLKIQTDFLMNNPSCDILSTDGRLFTDENKINFRPTNNIIDYAVRKLLLKDILIVNSISHSSVILRKSLAVYDESRNSQIDYELWLRLLYKSNIVFNTLPIPLTYHRIHVNQAFESKGFNYRLKSIWLVYFYAINTFDIKAIIINTLKIPYYPFSRLKTKNIAKKNYL